MTDIFKNSPFTLLGIVDDVTTCDCCGKKNLKRTVALDKDGDVFHYGTTCAAHALTGRRNRKTGELIWDRAVMVQRCKEVLPQVLRAVQDGLNEREATKMLSSDFRSSFLVLFGRYVDTGNKKPLRIFYNGWQIPGVEIPASDY